MASSRLPVFQEKFKELRGDLTQAQFADKLGLSRPTIGLYESGARIPDAEVLQTIAIRCHVSVDYLLGLTEFPAPEAKRRIAHEVTGLSERAFDNICALNKNVQYLKALNFILEKTAFFREVLSPVVKVLDSLSATDMDEYDASEEELALLDKLEERGYLVGSPFYCATIYSDRAGIALHDILERELFGDSETKRNTAEIERHWWGLFEHQEKEGADNGEQ